MESTTDIKGTENPVIPQDATYGGFWRRLAAFAIDCAILFLAVSLMNLDGQSADGMVIGAFAFLSLLYFVSMEASPLQATLGKCAVGLRVVDTEVGRISFGRAMGRTFSKMFPLLLFFLVVAIDASSRHVDSTAIIIVLYYLVFGVLFISFGGQKRGLHDFVAKTCVVQPDVSPLRNGIHSAVTCMASAVFLFTQMCPIHCGDGSVLTANMTAVGTRGKDIYVAISTAEQESGMSLWPKTYIDTTAVTNLISGKAYTTSTEYFTDIMLTEEVDGVDYSKFAGAGVRTPTTGVLMTASNNMWSVLVNVTDDDSGRLPLLITRNVDVEMLNRVLREGLSKKDFSTPMKFSTVHRTPFGNKGVVLIRKDGSTTKLLKRHATLGNIFGDTEIKPRLETDTPLLYLQP